VRKTLGSLECHVQQGTFPKTIAASAPRIQLTSEFADTDTARTTRNATDAAHDTYRKTVLANDIRLKKDEITALEAELSQVTVWTALRTCVTEVAAKVATKSQVPILRPNANGEPEVVSWETDPAAVAAKDNLLSDCGVYANRIAIMVENRISQADALKIKKKGLSDEARAAAGDVDDEMDGSHAGPSDASPSTIKMVVDKAVAAALARAGPQGVKRPHQGGGPSAAEKKRKRDEAKVGLTAPLSTARYNDSSLDSLSKYARTSGAKRRKYSPVSFATPSVHTRRSELRTKVMGGFQTRTRTVCSGQSPRKGKGRAPGKGHTARQRRSSSTRRTTKLRNRSLRCEHDTIAGTRTSAGPTS
jgi:hypothetical protein